MSIVSANAEVERMLPFLPKRQVIRAELDTGMEVEVSRRLGRKFPVLVNFRRGPNRKSLMPLDSRTIGFSAFSDDWEQLHQAVSRGGKDYMGQAILTFDLAKGSVAIDNDGLLVASVSEVIDVTVLVDRFEQYFDGDERNGP